MTKNTSEQASAVRMGAFAETADVALDAGAARIGPGRTRGTLGAAMSGLSAVSEIAQTGSVSKSTMLGTASSAAIMVGSRLIPGVGWAMAAYTVADLGSRAVLGKPFGETMIGQPIEWAAGKLGRGTLGVAKATTDLVGWKGASDFLENTVYPWAFPYDNRTDSLSKPTAQHSLDDRVAQAKASGLLPGHHQGDPVLLKGPTVPMSAQDWHEHQPDMTAASPVQSLSPGGTHRFAMTVLEPGNTLTTINPNPADILARRSDVLARDTDAIHQTKNRSHDLSTHEPIEGSAVPRSEIFKAALADQMSQSEAVARPDRIIAPRQKAGIEIDD